MNATNLEGHAWTGEKHSEGHKLFWIYKDDAGNLYESEEVPTYRIAMNNATLRTQGKRRVITPIV